MTDSLVHRGPDDASYFSDERVSLGARRLSIVDIEGGHQPVANAAGDVVVAFNGEIYNHGELRRELETRGHRFRSSHSDTEILPHLFEAHGPAFVDRLNGMFAIALWDARAGELHLWRDRCGIKPLFYATAGGRLVFGSEIKAILRHPAAPKRPDFAALDHYFSFKNVPAPLTAFEGISQVRPGEHVSFRDGAVSARRWWRPSFNTVDSGEREAAARIRALLEDSVRLQSRADVPYGALLSGGLDSSAVVSLMTRGVRTFTLVYDEPRPNKEADARFARDVARELGTEHHELVMSPRDVPEAMADVARAFDEPFSGTISTYFLCRLVARHVKVALTGDGADELFGSYLAHRTEADDAAKRMRLAVWDDAAKRELYTPAMADLTRGGGSEAWLRERFAGLTAGDPLNRSLAIDFETLLPDQVLAFVDRLSMAHSVELRPPFLDHRLVELVTALPASMKIKGGRVKHILKEAVADLLPGALVDRPKEGFVLPVHDWIGGELRGWAESVLAPERIGRHGLFRPPALGALTPARLWNLLSFQIWWEAYFG